MASDTKTKKTNIEEKPKKTAKTKTTNTKKTNEVKSTAKKTTNTSKPATKKTGTTMSKPASAKKTTKKNTTTPKATTSKKSDAQTAVKKTSAKKDTPKKTNTNKTSTTKTKPTVKKETKKPEIQILEKEEKLNKTIILTAEEKEQLQVNKIDEIEELKIEETIVEEEVTPQVSTILGLNLDASSNKSARNERIRFYAKDATIFAIIIPILDLFAMLFIDAYKAYPLTESEPTNYCLTLLIDFILIFVLTFLIDYIHGEREVRRINK